MSKYDATTTPGEKRIRTRQILFKTPHDQPYVVEFLEQEVIQNSDGEEEVLKNLGGPGPLTITDEILAEEFPLINPDDDTSLGTTSTGQQVLVEIYSWIRDQQNKRDAALLASETPPVSGA